MSLFSYEAVDAVGKRRTGEIEADSERAARRQLKGLNLVPRRVAAVSHVRPAAEHGRRRHLSGEETMTFLQQLAALFGAGLPLTDALATIGESMDSRRGRSVVLAIRQQVLEGGSLSQALASQGMEEIVCNMVAAGEETGQLEAVAVRLSELLEHRQRLRQELLSATLYPAIIMGFGILVLLFLLAYVIPQVVTVFDRAGTELPLVTVWVIAASSFFRDYGAVMLLALLAGMVGYRLALRLPEFRKRRDIGLLALPGLGAILSRIETSRFAHTLGMLLAGGVPILAAMQIAQESLRMVPIRDAVAAARETLREGGSLAGSLQASRTMPHLAVQMIQVGEQSGRLDEMLLRVAGNYEQEASRQLKRAVTLLEPLLVMVMALVVGAMAMAILLPIVQMNELIR